MPVVFVVFAFALFGWITIEPPRFLMNAAGKASTKGGLVGVFLMLRRLAMLADAISHAILPGIVVAFFIPWMTWPGRAPT